MLTRGEVRKNNLWMEKEKKSRRNSTNKLVGVTFFFPFYAFFFFFLKGLQGLAGRRGPAGQTGEKVWLLNNASTLGNFSPLRTVPTIVIAHTFCASPDTGISCRQCLVIKGYFCAI